MNSSKGKKDIDILTVKNEKNECMTMRLAKWISVHQSNWIQPATTILKWCINTYVQDVTKHTEYPGYLDEYTLKC